MAIYHNLTYENLIAQWSLLRNQALAQGDERLAQIVDYLGCCLEQGNPAPVIAILSMNHIPVAIEKFVTSENFLGNRIPVWPALMDDLKAMNPDVLRGETPIHEVFLGGATGTGKSTLAKITLLYQLYLVTCLRDPQAHFGLDPTTRIVFPLMSTNSNSNQSVLYQPLREMFEAMPYAQKRLTWNRRLKSSLEIEGGIRILPLIADQKTILGQAVLGGIIDEVNYMEIIKNSTRVAGPRGQGGHFDQAGEIYREIVQRRKSRFLNAPISIGCIFAISSTRYPNDFLEQRIREAVELDLPNVVVRQHKRYDVEPAHNYSGETFRLLVGDMQHRTRVLDDNETVPVGAQVEEVPIEFRDDFRRDPERSMQTIIGISVHSITPFIGQREKIVEAFEEGERLQLEQWVDLPGVILEADGMPRWFGEAIPDDPESRRFIHIDLSHTGDACGIAIVSTPGMVNISDPEGSGTTERKPMFVVEASISIQPSQNAELNYAELRRWIMSLITRYNINVHKISFDSYQSVDMRQAFRNAGVRSEVISVDRTIGPYTYLKECFYENRIAIVESPKLYEELVALELDQANEKVDHPPRGSKDIADAVCGAIWSAQRSRELRHEGGFIDESGQPLRTPRRRPEGRDRPSGY